MAEGWCKMRAVPGPRVGATLVELLVSLAVIGLLAALLLPAIQGAREAARRTACASNLRQIGIALATYHDAARTYPIGCQDNRGRQFAWSAQLLPLLENEALYQQIDFSVAYNSRENQTAGGTAVSIYVCPSTSGGTRTGDTSGDLNENGQWDPSEGLAWIDYGGMFGVGDPRLPLGNGVMIYETPIAIEEITDGLSNTILVGEDAGRGGQQHGTWIDGQNIFDQTGPVNRSRNNELFSDHPGGAHALLCDGSVRFLNVEMKQETLFAACTRALGD